MAVSQEVWGCLGAGRAGRRQGTAVYYLRALPPQPAAPLPVRRVVPAARWAEVCRNGVGVAFACTFLPASGDACPPDPAAKPVGEMRLLPAPGTLRRLPWHAAHALALVTMHREVDLSGVWALYCTHCSIRVRAAEYGAHRAWRPARALNSSAGASRRRALGVLPPLSAGACAAAGAGAAWAQPAGGV